MIYSVNRPLIIFYYHLTNTIFLNMNAYELILKKKWDDWSKTSMTIKILNALFGNENFIWNYRFDSNLVFRKYKNFKFEFESNSQLL